MENGSTSHCPELAMIMSIMEVCIFPQYLADITLSLLALYARIARIARILYHRVAAILRKRRRLRKGLLLLNCRSMESDMCLFI